MSLLLQNNILQLTEKKVEASLTPDNKANYTKIVVAGNKVALHGGNNSILASLQHSKDPISDCVNGAINLCLMMAKQSRGTMPPQALVPAAMTLMLQALDFADRAKIIKVGQPELIKASKLFADTIFKRAGVSKKMLQTAATNVHGITQDPAKVSKIKQVAGAQ